MKHSVTFSVLLSCLIFGTLISVAVAQQISNQEMASAIGFTEEDTKKVLAGQVVSADLPETTDSMLAQAIAAFVPHPPSEMAPKVLEGQTYSVDSNIVAFGKIDLQDIEGSLAKAAFTASESEEIEKLRNAKPGSDFNLSTEEFAAVQAAVAAGQTSAEQLSQVYLKILADRVRAYASGGISAIAPYDRGGSKISPAADLKAAAEAAAAKGLQKWYPDLYQAFVNYPKDSIDGVESSFLWVKQIVEERPTLTLEHRMVRQTPNDMIALGRQFYVGQSYDSAQFAGGAFPAEEGSLIYYSNRTMTDQVAGFMQSTRHSVGRGMMRDELVAHFQALQKK